MPDAHFEHIAIAVHFDDLAAWDRVMRSDLGGEALHGGAARKIGFQGGQVGYPNDGMLELLSWLPGEEEKSAMKRYVDRSGARAALHHLTFLVDDFDAAVEHSRELGYEPMLGRDLPHWREFYVREPNLRPKGFLIQVLFANKNANPGWGRDWAPFQVRHADAKPAARIEGAVLESADLEASARPFVELLGADLEARGDERVLSWPRSTMQLWLVPEGRAGHVRIRDAAGGVAATDVPEEVRALLRPEA